MAAAPSTGEAGWLFQQSAREKSSMAASEAPSTQKKKKKRTQPDPDAEVIALSPKTLMATNRFICEVCKKGFQREQNLQLHKRGHNLPWKLKQRSTKEIRKKVYLCPEPSCIHHNPSRALGDLTGIKKHFFRKHGEKKWRCEKCSKRYAVQSDWKAHSKTCGTKEYRCDCGTLFSRRDSFVTHRAFCDALAQENALSLSGMTSQLFGYGRATANQVSPQNQEPTYHEGNTNPSNNLPTAVGGDGFQSFGALLPPLGGSASAIVFGSPNHHEQDHDPNAPRGFFADIFSSDNFKGHQISPLYSSAVSIQNNNASTWAHLSATALLQKAAQVGSSCSTSTLLRSLGSSFSSSNHDFRASLGATNSRFFVGGGSTNSSMFGYSDDPHKNNLCNGETKLSFVRLLEDGNSKEQPQNLQNVSVGGCDRLTRDFLGVGQIVRHMSGGFAPNDLLQHQQGHQLSSKTSIGGVWTSLKDRITR